MRYYLRFCFVRLRTRHVYYIAYCVTHVTIADDVVIYDDSLGEMAVVVIFDNQISNMLLCLFKNGLLYPYTAYGIIVKSSQLHSIVL